MLTEIRVPKMNGAGWSFQKFNRRAQDWAIVGVAAWRGAAGSGVGLVNMGSTPVLATSVSEALAGGASVSDAAQLAAERGRTAERPQREHRVPHAPRQGARAAGARTSQRLTRTGTTLHSRRRRSHRRAMNGG